MSAPATVTVSAIATAGSDTSDTYITSSSDDTPCLGLANGFLGSDVGLLGSSCRVDLDVGGCSPVSSQTVNQVNPLRQ